MDTDLRVVLNHLIAAFEHHFDVAQRAQDDDEALAAAEAGLRDAFFTYDDELFTKCGVELPFDIFEDDEDDYDEDEVFDDEDEDDDDDDDITIVDVD